MRSIVAALLLLIVQQLCWRLPAVPSPDQSRPPAESLLNGGNSSAEPFVLTGQVVDASPTWGQGVRLTLDLESADDRPASGLVSVSLRETSRRWRTGDRLSLRSRLRRINGFGNFGELDWAAYNARRGIYASAYAWRDDDVTALPARDGIVDRLRRSFSQACERIGGQGAEILEALVIGDRTGIDRETSVAVRDAGLAHFLAISGSHMALIVALVVAVVRAGAALSTTLLERYDVLRAAALLAAVAVVAYGAISGGGVSVARSVLMAIAAMAALWRGRPGDDLRALGGSAIVLAVAMPGVGEEAGFQLSYLAVAALIGDSRRRRAAARQAAADARSTPRGLRHNGLEMLVEAARLTVVCWAVTTPVVAHHFQRVSLVAPLANLLAAPLVSAVVVSGLAALLLLPVSPSAGNAATWLGACLSDAIVRLSKLCASLPLAATTTPAPGAALTLVLSGMALVALLTPFRWKRALMAGCVLIAAALVVHGLHARWRSDRMDVWFASVGQGDGAIVRMPGGQVWVIDEGPSGRGRMVIAPLLRHAWIGRVEVLVASHVQADHAGALVEILEEFEVGEVWLPDGFCDGPAAAAIHRSAAARNVPVRAISALHRPTKAPARVEVLSPAGGAGRCNDNDQSLVLSFAFGGRRVLFTGDVEADAEAMLVRSPALRADVLKVPHHGSRTSSTAAFLDAVRPALAVASLGLDNQFHFPAPEVVARYAGRGIALLRTDREGSIHLAIDANGTMQAESFRGFRSRWGPGATAAPP